MSQKRHEKVLRRKAKMGRRGKQMREARRQQRIEDRRSDLEAVFGSLLPGQVAARRGPARQTVRRKPTRRPRFPLSLKGEVSERKTR